jgi:Na+/melibiose symporter-like transporter
LIISLPLLIWYPITRQKHAALLAQIKDREASGNS